MLNDQLDETTLAGAEMSVDTTARQAVEDLHWLLGEELFKFVGGHRNVVIRESLFVNGGHQTNLLRLTYIDERLTKSR